MTSKKKLLDTFRNNNPNLSQLDSLKDLLEINLISYTEDNESYQPNIYMGLNTYPSGPAITHTTICVNFSSVGLSLECKFTNKHLAAFTANDSYASDENEIHANEKDLMNTVCEWANNQVNKKKTP
jgi:hypothetical protein